MTFDVFLYTTIYFGVFIYRKLYINVSNNNVYLYILVLLCLQLYWLRAVQFNTRSACDASMFTSCIYIFLRLASKCLNCTRSPEEIVQKLHKYDWKHKINTLKIDSDNFTKLPANFLGENDNENQVKFAKFFNILLIFSLWLCVVQVAWHNFKRFSRLTDDDKISLVFKAGKISRGYVCNLGIYLPTLGKYITGSPISGCTCCHHNMYNILKGWQLPNGLWSVRTMYTNLHTKIFAIKHGKFEKILTLEGQWLLYNIWQVLFCFETTENSRILVNTPFRGKIWPMRALEIVTSGRSCAS